MFHQSWGWCGPYIGVSRLAQANSAPHLLPHAWLLPSGVRSPQGTHYALQLLPTGPRKCSMHCLPTLGYSPSPCGVEILTLTPIWAQSLRDTYHTLAACPAVQQSLPWDHGLTLFPWAWLGICHLRDVLVAAILVSAGSAWPLLQYILWKSSIYMDF